MAKKTGSKASVDIVSLKASVILAGCSFLLNAINLNLPLIPDFFRMPVTWIVIVSNIGVGAFLIWTGSKIIIPKN